MSEAVNIADQIGRIRAEIALREQRLAVFRSSARVSGEGLRCEREKFELEAVLRTLEWLRDNRSAIAVKLRAVREVHGAQEVIDLLNTMPGAVLTEIEEGAE